MARKSTLLDLDSTGTAGETTRRRPRAKNGNDRPWGERLRMAGLWLFCGVLVGGTGYAAFALDHFLATDGHFALRGGVEDNLKIEGARYASPQAIARVFSRDFGRSIYLLPMAERLKTLSATDWVQHASIIRQWPDRLVVKISERTPVAFAAVGPAGTPDAPMEMALVDAEGVIMAPPARAPFRLPVVMGLNRRQPLAMRKERIALMLQLTQEVRAYSAQISEIDLSDPEDVKISQMVGGRTVLLHLGSRNFLARLKNFLTHYGEISKRVPTATGFDLRLDDRIIVAKGPGNGL